MPSDIYVKKDTGWSTAVKNIYARTSSGWSSAIRYVYSYINAGWTRVWPFSGIYATTNPWISTTSSSSEISYGTVLRIGTTYRGNRGTFNPNGYTISSYQYKWVAYTNLDTVSSAKNYDPALVTLSGTTNDFTITGTSGANYDRGYIAFFITAKASSGSVYDGSADSLRYYVVRQKPRLATGGSPVFNITNPKIGDIMTYSSSWDVTDAYKPDAGRSTIIWYKNSVNSTTGGTVVQNNGTYSYTVQASDSGNYIYAVETVFNSGSDYELGNSIGVSASVITSSVVATAPDAFTYSISDISSVTTPVTPTQQRVSSTSNVVLVEMGSSKPSDTDYYELWVYGSGSSTGGTLANPAIQTITTLNQYDSTGAISASGIWDTVTNISSSASNSPISTSTRAIGTTRTIRFNVSTTTGAQSWAINYTVSGASSGNGTFTLNTNSMPATITISGASNPTITMNNVTAYAGLNQVSPSTAGTAGSQISLLSLSKPQAFSGTSTSNYTYYTNYQITGSQRRVTLPSAFTSGITLYVSTNGYINWGGIDPAGSTSIPSASNSGITVAPLSADLRQGSTTSSSNTSPGGLWYYADASTFVVTYWGNYYTDANQYARYQVTFYWGQSYADIIIVNNSLTTVVPSTTAVQNNANEYQNWSGTTTQTSTQLSTASMNRVSTNDGVDDSRTVLVASQPSAPSGGSASISGGTSPGTLLTLSKTDATGNPTPGVSWIWRRADGGTGGNSFSGGTILQNNGTTYQIQNADVGYSIRAEVTWSNGYLPNQVVTTNTITATSGTYTVTWNATANGGTGGGTTSQSAGVAHTAPSALKTSFTVSYSSTGQTSGSAPSATQGYYQTNGYYDTTSLSYTYGPVAVGGSFNPPYSITMYARYSTTSNAVTLATQGTLLRTGYTFSGWNIGGTTYAAGSSYTPTANVTATAVWTQNLQAPSGGSVTLTGTSTAGSVITASTSGWSGSPTSYDVFITTSTSGTPTSSSTRVASNSPSTSTTASYTITSGDAIAPANIFRAFAIATNAAGPSGTVQSTNTITATAASPATAPSQPAAPTNGWTGGLSYPFSWTAPSSPGTVTGGGAATITSYTLRIYKADSNTGTQPVPAYTSPWTTISNITTTNYTWTAPDSKYYSAGVIAVNSAGLSSTESPKSAWK